MRLQNPLAAVSTTGLDSQVLTVSARIEQYLSVDQIHRLLPDEGSAQGIRKPVGRLEDQGVVLERVIGRSFAYALNRDHLLVEAILIISNAKGELLSRMSQLISEWPIQPITVKLFGSTARNKMRADSDIDLLIVMPDAATVDAVEEAVRQIATQAALWTGNDVCPLVFRSSEMQPADIFSFILEEGIDIAGHSSWLREQLRRGKASA